MFEISVVSTLFSVESLCIRTVIKVKERISTVCLNGNAELRLPGIVNLCFNDVSGEALMNLLDLKRIYVSTGSACNAGESEPSHVLIALGLNDKQAMSAIRISYGRFNTIEQAEDLSTAICDAYNKIK